MEGGDNDDSDLREERHPRIVRERGTNQDAADNYEIWASPDSGLHNDPNFVCNASTNCLKTPVITAWDRAEAKWSIEKGADLAPLLAQTEQARSALKTLASEVKSDLLRIAVQNALTEMKSRAVSLYGQ